MHCILFHGSTGLYISLSLNPRMSVFIFKVNVNPLSLYLPLYTDGPFPEFSVTLHVFILVTLIWGQGSIVSLKSTDEEIPKDAKRPNPSSRSLFVGLYL